MLKKIDRNNMGKGNHGWLNTNFHFSFAEYYNPSNMNFGVLRVLNDDKIAAETGFGDHPHQDMEIVTYVIRGKLTHGDSMGNNSTLERGEVQYMSAGTGVYHHELNNGDEELRLLQIWIIPDKKGYNPNYGEQKFRWEDRIGNWLHMVSGKDNSVPINIHQDVEIYSNYIEKNGTSSFKVEKGRQAYLVQIEGKSTINNLVLNEGDALEIVEENIEINVQEDSHYIILEMMKY